MKGLKLEPHNLTIRRIPCNMQCGVRATTAGVGLPALDRAPIDAVRPVSEVTAAHRVARPHRMDVHQAVSAIAHNGCLRIMPHAAYANAGRVANAADRLRGAASQFINEFWAAPSGLSIRCGSIIRTNRWRPPTVSGTTTWRCGDARAWSPSF